MAQAVQHSKNELARMGINLLALGGSMKLSFVINLRNDRQHLNICIHNVKSLMLG